MSLNVGVVLEFLLVFHCHFSLFLPLSLSSAVCIIAKNSYFKAHSNCSFSILFGYCEWLASSCHSKNEILKERFSSVRKLGSIQL